MKLTMVTTLVILTALKTGGAAEAVVLTFDDISTNNIQSVPNGYGELNWENFSYVNSSSNPAYQGAGYVNGNVSGDYVAFNRYGDPATLRGNGLFDFSSAYLSSAWNNGLSITVEGLNNGLPLYSTTVGVDTKSPKLFDFNYLGVDQLRFTSFGGDNGGFEDSRGREGTQFILDNFTFQQTPTVVADVTEPVVEPTIPVVDVTEPIVEPTTPTPIPYEPSSALGLLMLGAFGASAMLKSKLQ
jgi:hypothetical protein